MPPMLQNIQLSVTIGFLVFGAPRRDPVMMLTNAWAMRLPSGNVRSASLFSDSLLAERLWSVYTPWYTRSLYTGLRPSRSVTDICAA